MAAGRDAQPAPGVVEPGPPTVEQQQDGSFVAVGHTYRAVVGTDGNLHSLKVGDEEMIDDRVAISLGAFFYSGGPVKLVNVTSNSPGVVVADDGRHSIQYHFLRREVRATLSNNGPGPVSYFIVLSPQVAVITNLRTGEAAAAPAGEQWEDVRLCTQSGAFLELSGGGRLWGPWLGRQVWWLTRINPQESIQIRLRAGLGEPPKPTLEQLVGLRASSSAPDALVAGDSPVMFVATVENRSDADLTGLLSMELSASRSDQVIYSATTVNLPSKQVTNVPFGANVQEPDFYSARFSLAVSQRDIASAVAVAGYRADQIRPAVARPAGFREFWDRLRREVGDDPPAFRMELDLRRTRADVAVWVVRLEGLRGRAISGWYLYPRTPGPHPTILYLSGYGARPIEPPFAIAGQGYAVLAIDVRGNQVNRPRPRPFEDYATVGIESPDTYVYREIVGHCLRALHFLAARREADPHRIAVLGISEGGGLALIIAALSPQLKAVAATAPMLCDFPLSLRSAAWPYTEIARYAQSGPDQAAEVLHTLSYFDAGNFAPDIRCPVLVTVGLLDRVSLPAAVFGVYNLLPGPKEIRALPNAGHEGGGEDLWAYKLAWLAERLQPADSTNEDAAP